MKECACCGKQFSQKAYNQKYCSHDCARKIHTKQERIRNGSLLLDEPIRSYRIFPKTMSAQEKRNFWSSEYREKNREKIRKYNTEYVRKMRARKKRELT
jgi:recombinational DNA repair protein (RecF pathway)